MKNFAGLFFILLVMQGVQGMDLAKGEKPYNPTDEQCMRVALYLSLGHNKTKRDRFESSDENIFRNPLAVQKTKQFLQDTDNAMAFLKSIPKIKGCELDSQTKALSENVKFIAGELSRSNMFVFVTYNRDFFTAMCHACLPKKYEDRAGFFSEKSNAAVRIVDSKNLPVYPVFNTEEMIQKLSEKTFVEAFSFLHFAEIRKNQSSKVRRERVISDSSCTKVVAIHHVPSMDYQWTYLDYENSTSLQRTCLETTRECSNNYQNWGVAPVDDEDHRYVIAEKDINILQPKEDKTKSDYLKQFILKNQFYGTAQIKTDIAPLTTWEKFFNKILYWFPHAIVMIIPDVVQSQIDGVCNSAIGIAVCAAGSFGFGEYVYPRIDSCNYNVHKLSQWFGPNNHRKKRAGSDFVYISIISSLANLAAQKLLSWPVLPWKLLGGGIYATRTLISGIALIDGENRANKDPFNRRNKDGVSFTLKDLANGPKFDPR